MEEEKIIDQTTEAATTTEEPVAEPAPKKRRKRRTKTEIEADAKAAAEKAKQAAKKAAATAKRAEKKVERAAKQVVEEGTQTVERVVKPRIPTPAIVVQYSGAEIDTSTLTETAVAQFRMVKKRAGIRDIKLYVKPEENAAYFVINGDFTGKIDF